MKYFRIFGSKCYILNDRENPRKFDAKSDEGIFLGYSTNSRAYRVYNKRTKTVMESINVVIDDTIFEKGIDNDGEGNYSAFMTIAHIEPLEDLNLLIQELGDHSDEESMGVVEESDAEED